MIGQSVTEHFYSLRRLTGSLSANKPAHAHGLFTNISTAHPDFCASFTGFERFKTLLCIQIDVLLHGLTCF